jgi:glycerol kinase
MMHQSDLFDFKVIRPKMLETTALGAAYLAGLAVGYWDSVDDTRTMVNREFNPEMSRNEADKLVHNWDKAGRASNWIEDQIKKKH